MRTPLTRLTLRADTLSLEQDRIRFLKDIREMDTLLTGTLDHLRGVANPEIWQPLDVWALLDSVVADFQDTGHLLEWAIKTPPPCAHRWCVRGQHTGLRRCPENLVSNALRYGGLTVVEVVFADPWIRVRVKDRGPGIPEADLERVFQPFVQLAVAPGVQSGGAGMGLATARAIAHQYGGTLVLSNRVGGGLCAELTLPCHPLQTTPFPYRV